MPQRDWTEVSAFDGIALTDSWLMAFWPGPDRSLVWRVDFRLGPKNGGYRPPKAGEVDCFRIGSIVVKDCASIAMAAPHLLLPSDLDRFDFGEIRSCKISDHGIALSAETVSFEVRCSSYSIELDEE